MGRRLGQHFLFDPGILGRIADAALLTADSVVLEIGPGKGPLTRELAARAARVVAIEADRELAALLTERPPAPNVEIITGDALRVSWPEADVIAGNIPYQITSPLIERALTPPRPQRIVFLVQLEVADRLVAAPGTEHYGAMSAGVQLVAEVEKLFTVKAGAFAPPPRVDSAVVRITPRQPTAHDGRLAAERETRALIAALFQRRRQQIQRSLRDFLSHAPRTTHHAPIVADIIARLRDAGFDPAARPEQLSPSDFSRLAALFPRS